MVVAAELAGVLILGRSSLDYWAKFDSAISTRSSVRPLDAIATVFRFQMNHELKRPYFDTSRLGNSHVHMPFDHRFHGQIDIFWGAVQRLADESGCFDYPRAHRKVPDREEWDTTVQFLANRFEAIIAPLRERLDADKARRKSEEQQSIENARRTREEFVRSRPAPPPSPQRYGVSPRGAEMIVVEWMRHMGILDAEITRASADGGVDATSSTHVAQVKHYKGKVGVPEVRQLFGVAASERKIGLFFTSTGYTVDALSFATAVGMPLFTYNAELSELHGLTAQAIRML
ncbi:restriction endonuclease [Salinibacterium sp. SWN248]|uniref:restriction endonuclease n=1 Tax=Salinibacterium sp. SWN248 TaxID=2792056 RepID=UPI0018CE5A31|nr:restriction endonuclease [Salinibacterium sp. SWN248]MBH0024422.1 restriction endonuclease [Salinibacterium sp. SWN248]